MQLTAIIREHTRTQCAAAALSRVEQPPVNLIGIYDNEAQTRRRRCHEAALLRYVMPTETAPEVQYSKTRKRGSRSDTEVVNQTLLEMCGKDSWVPLLCGYAHTLKRPKLELCDDTVRKAMLGKY
jgi:hypothetical protein